MSDVGKANPLISLLITARNDNYMGDFKWRLATMLNGMALSARVLDRLHDIEAVVCDWGSDVPLHQDMTLTPDAQAMTRFVVVPPDVAKEHQANSKFPDSICFNVAARRARGLFLGMTGSDVMFMPASLHIMFEVLGGKFAGVDPHRAVYLALRRHIPIQVLKRQPPLKDFLAYLNRNAFFFPEDHGGVGTGAPTNLILLSKHIWHECRGLDQTLVHWGWNDVDLVLRTTQFYPLVYLDHFGVNLLHMEHWDRVRSYDPKTMFRQMNKANETAPFRANDEHWGLADRMLDVAAAVKAAPLDDAPPPAAGSVETWNISATQLAEQLANDEVLKIVQEVIANMRDWLPAHELNALQLLTWYALARSPLGYVEVGMRYPHAATVVSKACPGVEMHLVTDWGRPREDEHRFSNPQDSLPTLANNALCSLARHWSYTRFVGGDSATALDRLLASHGGTLRIELAHLHANPHVVDPPAQAIKLAQMLRPGGAIVITASDPARYQAVAQVLHSRFPLFSCFNVTDAQNGMFLAAKLRGNQ
jgi:hypothetical protein